VTASCEGGYTRFIPRFKRTRKAAEYMGHSPVLYFEMLSCANSAWVLDGHIHTDTLRTLCISLSTPCDLVHDHLNQTEVPCIQSRAGMFNKCPLKKKHPTHYNILRKSDKLIWNIDVVDVDRVPVDSVVEYESVT